MGQNRRKTLAYYARIKFFIWKFIVTL